MGAKNFIPQLWAAGVLKERDKVMIAAKHCTREYEGEIKQHGDRVKILTVGPVASKTYTKNTDIDDPDTGASASQFLDIDQAKYCHIYCDDLDKAQMNDGYWTELKRQMGLTMANDIDSYIFQQYSTGTAMSAVTLTSANVISTLAALLQKMQENNVPDGETKYLEVSPAVYNKIVLSRIVKETMNTKVIDGATVPVIYGFETYMSNNVYQANSVHYCVARTKRSTAIATQITETKAYEPPKRFGDAVKSLQVWGAKVIVPKEFLYVPITIGSESSI